MLFQNARHFAALFHLLHVSLSEQAEGRPQGINAKGLQDSRSVKPIVLGHASSEIPALFESLGSIHL